MPYMIVSDNCSACSACQFECPNKAIVEKGGTFLVDTEKCTECVGFFDEPQCVSVCPVDKTVVIDPGYPRYATA